MLNNSNIYDYLFISPFYKNKIRHGGVKRTYQIIEDFCDEDFYLENPYINFKEGLKVFTKNNFITKINALYFSLRLFFGNGITFKGLILIFFKCQKFLEIINSNKKKKIILEGGGDLPIIFSQYLIQKNIKFSFFLSNIEYLVPDENKSNYFRSNYFKYKLEIKGYKNAEKLITISNYDSSIIACHGIKSDTFQYYPIKQERKKLRAIRNFRKLNSQKIIKDGNILIIGTINNPPTRIGIEKIIKDLNKINLGCKIKLAGFGTNKIRRLKSKNLDILGAISDQKLIELMKNAKCLIINQVQTSGFLIKLVEFNLAGIPILITSDYFQAKNLEKYGIFYKKLDCLSASYIKKILQSNYRVFNKPKFQKSMLKNVYY